MPASRCVRIGTVGTRFAAIRTRKTMRSCMGSRYRSPGSFRRRRSGARPAAELGGRAAYNSVVDLLGNEYIREKVETTVGWQFTSGDEHWMNGFPAKLKDFCAAVTNDRKPLSGALLARDVLAVSYTAYLAAEEGRAVDLAPYLRWWIVRTMVNQRSEERAKAGFPTVRNDSPGNICSPMP